MAVNVQFSIWIATKTRRTHLTKAIQMPAMPRVGEYVKFRNNQEGDYFAWRVTQVTYREGADTEVWTELLDDIEGRGYSFETEDEFDTYFQSYIAEGWSCERGVGRNTRYEPPATPSDDDGGA